MVNRLENNAVTVSGVSKTYNFTRVVDNISFEVKSGEIFGLIGPNGAGKSTTIRMIMDIIKPDSGEITVLGEKISNQTKNNIGYLPEERGLYRKAKVIDSLVYLALLKGVDPRTAKSRAEELMDRVGMLEHAGKKTEELSRGMGQLIQFLVTIIHDPGLVILDEPSAGLDPVNTELLKTLILEMRNKGKAVIMSTHRMNEVEELCDRIFMINKGKSVLYGDIRSVKERFRGNSVIVSCEGKLPELKGVSQYAEERDYTELFLEEGITSQNILEQLVAKKVRVDRFEIATPSLNEIFIHLAGEE
ncbi:MAG: ATP-binding cassette domain-containing protein [Dehalococcoidales bacterium]|nr:ATP-binding cassette domain-containing protein [Dehalococcoidales bacterium]